MCICVCERERLYVPLLERGYIGVVPGEEGGGGGCRWTSAGWTHRGGTGDSPQGGTETSAALGIN